MGLVVVAAALVAGLAGFFVGMEILAFCGVIFEPVAVPPFFCSLFEFVGVPEIFDPCLNPSVFGGVGAEFLAEFFFLGKEFLFFFVHGFIFHRNELLL